MNFLTRFALVLAVAFAFESNAYAQEGTIVDGNAMFQFNGIPATPGSANFFATNVAGGADNIFQNWWWYRTVGDSPEVAMPQPDAESYIGNQATLNWTTSISSFDASLTIILTDIGGAATVTETMVITNTDVMGYSLNLFNYLDADVGGTAGGDSASLVAANAMRVADGMTFLDFGGPGALAYQVTSFPSLRTALNDNFETNLNDTGLPFGPGDFTGAYQWRQFLNPGESATFVETITISVPEPSTFAMLGICGLAAVYRRRR